MIRYKFNQQVSPPAPFVHVTIGRPVDEEALPDIAAQLDTAADMTVVPWHIVEAPRLDQLDEVPTLGFGGHITAVPTSLVRLGIRQFEPVVVEVPASRDEPHVLLGRDLLNRYRLVLDGPSLILEIDGHPGPTLPVPAG